MACDALEAHSWVERLSAGQKMQNRQPGRRARRSLSESFTFSNAKAARWAALFACRPKRASLSIF